MPISHRTQIQDRRGDTKLVGIGYPGELDISGLEGLADRGQSHIGDGRIDIGDNGAGDKGGEYEPSACWGGSDRTTGLAHAAIVPRLPELLDELFGFTTS